MPKQAQGEEQAKPKYPERECIVNWIGVEEENRDLQISSHVIGIGKKVFAPGQRVSLIQPLIDNLRAAVEEQEIPIPPESAIYEATNPLEAARKQWPGFRAQINPSTGVITMFKSRPKYSVEYVD